MPLLPVRLRKLVPALLGLLLASAPVSAAAASHDLYLCVSMAGTYVVGAKVQRLNGIYRSTDRQEVVHLGFNHPRQDALAADPRDPRILYTAGLNGVLRSTDAGATWRIMTGWEMTEPKDIIVDPHQPDRIYIALPDGIGVSEDRGQTWQRRQHGIRRAYTQAIVADRATAGSLVAGTELGIYRSEDDARSWHRVLTTRATVTDVQQSPLDPARFLAATQRDGAWESSDHGRTWQRLRGLPIEHTMHNIEFDPTHAERMVVGGWGLGVRVSEDGGRTWQDRSAGLPNPNIWRVAADPDYPGRLYASPHESPIFVSDDFGRTWRTHWFEGATVWDFAFVPRR
jgi:hypothetical protein